MLRLGTQIQKRPGHSWPGLPAGCSSSQFEPPEGKFSKIFYLLADAGPVRRKRNLCSSQEQFLCADAAGVFPIETVIRWPFPTKNDAASIRRPTRHPLSAVPKCEPGSRAAGRIEEPDVVGSWRTASEERHGGLLCNRGRLSGSMMSSSAVDLDRNRCFPAGPVPNRAIVGVPSMFDSSRVKVPLTT